MIILSYIFTIIFSIINFTSKLIIINQILSTSTLMISLKNTHDNLLLYLCIELSVFSVVVEL